MNIIEKAMQKSKKIKERDFSSALAEATAREMKVRGVRFLPRQVTRKIEKRVQRHYYGRTTLN